MLNLPIKILDRIVVGAGGVADVAFTLGNLVTEWDAREGITSRHLVVIVNAASPDAVAQRDVRMQFNGDDGNNYNYQIIEGENGTVTAPRVLGITAINVFPIPGTTYANAFGGGQIVIPDAFGGNLTSILSLGGAAEDEVEVVTGRWLNVATITSVRLFPDTGEFAEGSEFLLGVIDERYLVEEIILAADGLVHFRNIPQGEGDLVIIGIGRSGHNTFDNLLIAFNEDTVNANYARQQLQGAGGAILAASNPDRRIGALTGDDNPTSLSPFVMTISQFTKGQQPHYTVLTGRDDSNLQAYSGRRNNIEPIHSVSLSSQVDAANELHDGYLASLYRVPKRVIERIELTAPQATITFDNIPDYYEALILHVYARSDSEMGSLAVQITINADAVLANYNKQELFGVLGVVTAQRSEGNRSWLLISDNARPAGEFSGGSLLFLGYAEADRHKHVIGLFGHSDNSVVIQSSRWLDVDAIISIALTTPFNNFLAGSVFELEGVLRKEGLPADAGMRIGIP